MYIYTFWCGSSLGASYHARQMTSITIKSINSFVCNLLFFSFFFYRSEANIFYNNIEYTDINVIKCKNLYLLFFSLCRSLQTVSWIAQSRRQMTTIATVSSLPSTDLATTSLVEMCFTGNTMYAKINSSKSPRTSSPRT